MDCGGVGVGRTKLLKYLKPTASLNSIYYPESVKQILVVNCPSIITWLYSFVKPFIPETTQKKIVFTSGNGHEELLSWTKDDSLIPKVSAAGSSRKKENMRVARGCPYASSFWQHCAV